MSLAPGVSVASSSAGLASGRHTTMWLNEPGRKRPYRR